MSDPIKVLIVDQNVRCRDVLRSALDGLPDIVVAGISPNGKLGLDRARFLKPDLVVLDASLTDLSAPEYTQTVLVEQPQLGILVSSSNEPDVADQAILALEAGAFDFVVKPVDACKDEAIESLRRLLLPRIRSFSIRRYSQMAKSLSPCASNAGQDAAALQDRGADDARSRLENKLERRQIEAVVIGASTGGPEALAHLLPALQASFPVPVVVVLHMPKLFTSRMAAALDRESALAIREAKDGEEIERGVVYLAPGGLHLTVERGTRGRRVLRTTDGEPENGCKPSVDVLFRSAALVFGGRVLAVVLTGMGNDGTEGLKALKKCEAPALVQDEKTSVVWGMPGSAAQAGCADEILPLHRIAKRMLEIVESR